MMINFHGGKCCGVKTIAGFTNLPTDMVSPSCKTETVDYDRCGGFVNSNQDFFTDAAPKETGSARLGRMIAFIKKWRPQGIVEIILADNAAYYDTGLQQSFHWRKIIEEYGFEKVSSCYNSNSTNIISVFHLKLDKKKQGVRIPHPYAPQVHKQMYASNAPGYAEVAALVGVN